MTVLLTLLLSLLPLSAFAGDLRSIHPHSYNDPSEGVLVIPDGHGGVNYWRGQGGMDAYTAGIVGQAMTQQFQRSQPRTPLYTLPPLVAPEFRSRSLSEDQAVHDRVYDFLSGR